MDVVASEDRPAEGVDETKRMHELASQVSRLTTVIARKKQMLAELESIRDRMDHLETLRRLSLARVGAIQAELVEINRLLGVSKG